MRTSWAMRENLCWMQGVLRFSRVSTPVGRGGETRPHSQAEPSRQVSAGVGGDTKGLALNGLALLHPSWPWEREGGWLGPREQETFQTLALD